ncbi:hypothetical protein M407DRAFT_27526 [Tulasnella calospora MUT 4182]|uniref:BTB domain-containing protein n=1 Tax=Tulasnella calospora MUT 4182 TaxID=1051891 RepID=A0A0C3KNM8_9AGAM|nr:hypothetical protein M407DRAFT_27526 [Tulasnella calospora MUT 4182]
MSGPMSEDELDQVVTNIELLELQASALPPETAPNSGPQPEPEAEGGRFAFPRHILKQSDFFRDMLTSTHIGGGGEGTEINPIVPDSISQVTKFQIESFYRVVDHRGFQGQLVLSQPQWFAALKLATAWNFDQVRQFIIQELDFVAVDPFDRIRIADECRVPEWLRPALARLCARKSDLTAAEGRALGYERFAAICRIREMEKLGSSPEKNRAHECCNSKCPR